MVELFIAFAVLVIFSPQILEGIYRASELVRRLNPKAEL